MHIECFKNLSLVDGSIIEIANDLENLFLSVLAFRLFEGEFVLFLLTDLCLEGLLSFIDEIEWKFICTRLSDAQVSKIIIISA